MKTLSTLKKELSAIDSKIAKFPVELFRKVRAVESMRLHLGELVESLDIGSEVFDPGSLDQTDFAAKSHKALGRVRARLEEHACYGIVVEHYRSDPEFVKVSGEIQALAKERAEVSNAIHQAEEQVEKLRKEELAALEAAKEQAIKDVEAKGTPLVVGVRKRISELMGG